MAKTDFLAAITQLAAEKNLPKEVVLEAVEAALASAHKRDELATKDVVVKIDQDTGDARVFTRKTVVDEIEDEETEVLLEDARKTNAQAQLGEGIDTEVEAMDAGRVAAQTAKQVVLQRLREAEREVVFDEYEGREGDIVSGEMVRMEGRNVIVDIGKAEALLPGSEQVRIEHYRSGQRMKFYILEVYKAAKGPQVIVSRTHKNLIRRLFEMEVPEIFKGTVEIKAIAREAGFRTKVAVWSTQEGVDPVGACVGLRGLRIQNIVNELNGERVDIILWDPDPGRLVAHALSPAQVVHVETDEATNTAIVVVPDRQLSLAIGKEGQNARLAAKLTGWRIDIKSQSAYEEVMEKLPEPPAAVAAPVTEEKPVEEKAPTPEEEAVAMAAAPGSAPAAEEASAGSEETATPAEEPASVPEREPAVAGPRLRFAEEILPPDRDEAADGSRGRRKGRGREGGESEGKPKKAKRPRRVMYEEEDEYEYEDA